MGAFIMYVELLGFPTTLGLPRKALRHGPDQLRLLGLVTALERHASVLDFGDLPLPPSDPNDPVALRVEKVVAAARRQAEHWVQHHRQDGLMLTLGGDHSTSLGTIWALAQLGCEFDVVWVDAHGDFNIIETSPSGNPHGMVLALACGLMPDHLPRLIPPSALKLWGIRDLDPGEKRLLEREGVQVKSPAEVRSDWHGLIEGLGPNVFISFDCDSVEPAESPGTMTPVPDGFSRREALELVTAIARKRRVLALDLVEFYPDRDRDDLTRSLAADVAEAVVAAQADFLESARLAATRR
jgi:arginase